MYIYQIITELQKKIDDEVNKIKEVAVEINETSDGMKGTLSEFSLMFNKEI